MLLGFAEGVSRKQHRACHIWEASTHPHVDLPLLCYICTQISPSQPLPFPCLLPPLTFQGKYYKNSFKQVFLAHFGCLRRTVGMALSRGIFLRNRTWAFLGMVSFSTERSLFRNKAEQNPSSSFSLYNIFSPLFSFLLTTLLSSCHLLESLLNCWVVSRLSHGYQTFAGQSIGGKTET